MMIQFIERINDYIFYSSDGELTEFFTYIHSLKVGVDSDEYKYFKLYNIALYLKDPDNYVENYFKFRGLLIEEKSSDELVSALKSVISGNQKAWDEYKKGNDKAIGRFIGLLVKEHKLDPKIAKDIIESNRKLI